MGLHNKHAWNSWQSEERQHSSRHAPQVPIEQKITQGGRKIGVQVGSATLEARLVSVW